MMSAPLITIFTANEPQVMRLVGDLAEEIGLNESIVLMQLEFLVRRYHNEQDGKLWAYATLADLQREYFKWWSIATISRILARLEEKQLIHIGNFNAHGYDRTQWFAMNEEGLGKLTSIKVEVTILQNAKSNTTDCKKDHAKLQKGSRQLETTIPENILEGHEENITTTMPTTTDQSIPTGVGGGGPETTASSGKRAATRPGNAPSPSSAAPSPPCRQSAPVRQNPDPPVRTETYLYLANVVDVKSPKALDELAHLPLSGVQAAWEKFTAGPGAFVEVLRTNPPQPAPPPPAPADLPERPEWIDSPEEWAAMCRATPTMAGNLAGSRWENGQLVGESDYMTEFYAKRGYAERITMARALQQGRAAT